MRPSYYCFYCLIMSKSSYFKILKIILFVKLLLLKKLGSSIYMNYMMQRTILWCRAYLLIWFICNSTNPFRYKRICGLLTFFLSCYSIHRHPYIYRWRRKHLESDNWNSRTKCALKIHAWPRLMEFSCIIITPICNFNQCYTSHKMLHLSLLEIPNQAISYL